MTPLLKINGLRVGFPAREGTVEAVAGVSFDINPGEVFALVGESGSGKSTVCKAIMGLLPPRALVQGQVTLGDQDLSKLPPRDWTSIRGAKAGMILQDAQNALQPFMTLARQIGESLRLDTPTLRGPSLRNACLDLLRDAGFPDPSLVIDRYPHQLSGGQAQRAVIAVVRARKPHLIIADEPTTAVDVTTQAQFIGYMRQMAAQTGAAILVVTHDFGLVSEIADRVGVMRHGQLLEVGQWDQMITQPANPYTQLLLRAARSVLLSDPEHVPSGKAGLSKGADVTVDALTRIYQAPRPLMAKPKPGVHAVDDVSFSVPAGTIAGIGGESGCGKSSLSRLVCGLDTPQSGQVRIGGKPVDDMSVTERARTVQYVFQNPFASMNPRLRIFGQVRETLDVLGIDAPRARNDKVRDLLVRMGLPPELHHRFPHELSGGQLQRTAIAAAMVAEPRVLVCDEPVSALDVSVRSTVLHAMMQVRAELGTTILLVGHDLGLFRAVCDQLLVMFAGRVVESGPVKAVLDTPRHPYTQHLVAAAPQIGLSRPARVSRLSDPAPEWRSHPGVVHSASAPAPEPLTEERELA